MDNPGQYDDLLTKYLLNELSGREEELVSAWVNLNAENQAYFERFKTVWNILSLGYSMNEIDVDQEWNDHKRMINGGEFIPGLKKHLRKIYEIRRPENGGVRRFWPAAAAAASIILLLGLSIYFFDRHEMNATKAGPVGPQPEVMRMTSLPPVRIEVNASSSLRKLVLEDGSGILLYPHSEVSYVKKFPGNAREIRLTGKADFRVFKDKAKPFTVQSGDISITALGTEFMVTAFEKGAEKTVKLYEGKVVIRSSVTATKKLSRDFYLLPGQEFVYDNRRATAVIRAFKSPGSPDRKDKNRNSDDLLLPENFKGSWFMFNNQSLPEVLTQLQDMFNADIEFRKSDLEKMYFIGKFNKSDSLDDILNRMTILYHLKLTKKNNKYLISK